MSRDSDNEPEIDAGDEDLEDDSDSPTSWKEPAGNGVRIEDLISEGQEIMIQVAKSSIGSKGPRVTTHISIAGRYMVLMPTVDHIGISKRIQDDAERQRLKDILRSIRPNSFGYIFRTQAEGI